MENFKEKFLAYEIIHEEMEEFIVNRASRWLRAVEYTYSFIDGFSRCDNDINLVLVHSSYGEPDYKNETKISIQILQMDDFTFNKFCSDIEEKNARLKQEQEESKKEMKVQQIKRQIKMKQDELKEFLR